MGRQKKHEPCEHIAQFIGFLAAACKEVGVTLDVYVEDGDGHVGVECAACGLVATTADVIGSPKREAKFVVHRRDVAAEAAQEDASEAETLKRVDDVVEAIEDFNDQTIRHAAGGLEAELSQVPKAREKLRFALARLAGVDVPAEHA